ncbi:MAG TPA: recombinase RecT [Gallionella sp.]|nr:recombinase RecT [Gallionella sp.]
MSATQLQTMVSAQKGTFLAAARPGFDTDAKWAAESGFAMQVLSGNDFLMKVALGNPDSLKAAIVNVAAIGTSLNPAAKQAYLVPRNQKVCLDISYMGLLQMAMQDGCILWGQARVVRNSDTFEMRGLSQEPIHTYNPFSDERGDIIGAYVTVKLPNGDFLTHAMPMSLIDKIRGRSEAYKRKSGPWVTDPEEMIKKTVIKQAAKTWPKGENGSRLEQAVHYMDTDGGEGIVLSEEPVVEDIAITVEQIAQIEAGLTKKGKTWEQLRGWCAQHKSVKRDVPTISDLTRNEAASVISIALAVVAP